MHAWLLPPSVHSINPELEDHSCNTYGHISAEISKTNQEEELNLNNSGPAGRGKMQQLKLRIRQIQMFNQQLLYVQQSFKKGRTEKKRKQPGYITGRLVPLCLFCKTVFILEKITVNAKSCSLIVSVLW